MIFQIPVPFVLPYANELAACFYLSTMKVAMMISVVTKVRAAVPVTKETIAGLTSVTVIVIHVMHVLIFCVDADVLMSEIIRALIPGVVDWNSAVTVDELTPVLIEVVFEKIFVTVLFVTVVFVMMIGQWFS